MLSILSSKKKISVIVRASGVILIGVFLANLYIALYDKNLSLFNQLHYYLNWIITAMSLVAAIIILAKPLSVKLVLLAGIIWPVVYVGGLAADVESRLCLGTSANCWPDTNSAFQYLILNNPNVPNGYGWMLWPYTIPTALILLALVVIISAFSLFSISKQPPGNKDKNPKELERWKSNQKI